MQLADVLVDDLLISLVYPNSAVNDDDTPSGPEIPANAYLDPSEQPYTSPEGNYYTEPT